MSNFDKLKKGIVKIKEGAKKFVEKIPVVGPVVKDLEDTWDRGTVLKKAKKKFKKKLKFFFTICIISENMSPL